MRTLLRRDFNEFNLARNYDNQTRAFFIIYGILVIGVPIILWLLGPGLIGFFDVEGFNNQVSVIGMIITMQTVSSLLQREDANQQMTFLQTLPVKKSDIVQAKFGSVLLFCGITIIWIVMTVSLYVLLSGNQMEEHWLLVSYFSSLIIFIAAITLLTYFLWGSRHIFLISILSIFIWGGLFFAIISGFFMNNKGNQPSMSLLTGSVIISLAIYFLCWWIAVSKVNKKGFPVHNGGKAGRAYGGESSKERRST